MKQAKAIDRYLKKKPGTLPTLASWLGGLAVTLLPFFQHWLLWFPDRLNRRYLHGDFIEHFGPRGFIYQAVSEGRLPLWDPYKETGLPTLDYIFDLFNPLLLAVNLLFLEDGFMRNHASQITLVLHYSIGALGAYLWVLSLGLGRTAALLMGVVWSSCGFMLIKSAGHDTMIHTTAWAPYMFMFLDKARRTGSLAASGWAGFFLAMVFIGGHPQIFYMFALMLAIYAVYYAVVFCRLKGFETAWGIMWRTFAPMGVMAFLFASPQIMHSVGGLLGDGLARVHPAGDMGDLLFSGSGSGDLRYLPYFLLPGLEKGFIETYVYAGVLPLIFAAVALYYIRLKEEGYWKVMVIAGVVLMMGNSIGLHKFLIDLLPGYVLFRCGSRFAMLVHIAIGMLAAYGVHWLLSSPEPPGIQTARRAVKMLAGMLGLLLLASLTFHHFELSLANKFDQNRVLNALTAALLLVGAAWIILERVSKDQRGPGLRLLISVLVILDLGFYHQPMTAYEKRDFYPDPSEISREEHNLAKFLVKTTQNKPVRFELADKYMKPMVSYRYGIMVTGLEPKYLNRIFSRPYWDIRWRMAENPRFIDLFGIEYAECGLDVLKAVRSSWKLVRGSQSAIDLEVPKRIGKIELLARGHQTGGLQQGETIAWLALAKDNQVVAQWPLRWGREISGVKTALDMPGELAADEVLLSSAHPKAFVDLDHVWLNGKKAEDKVRYGQAAMNLCKNVRALPLVFFAQRASVLEPYPEYLDALTSVDPSRCVLFREPIPGYQLPGEPSAGPGGGTELISFEPQRVEVKVRADRPGFAVMSQTASFGWSARLDDKEIPIHKAYGFLCAVQVPAGEHTLVFSYAEPLVKTGLLVMALSFAGLVLFTFWCRKKEWCSDYGPDA